MRKRTMLAIACVTAIAGVMTFQAVTSATTAPEPYVRIDHFRVMPPVARYGCENGEKVILYTTGEHEELDPVPTGEPC